MCLWTSEWRSVSSDWTARCWLNIQSGEKIWTYWHENLRAPRQSWGWIVSMCFFVCARDVVPVKLCVSPGAPSVSEHYPCVWGWPQLEGWKAEVDGWMHRWAVRDCFKIRCTHSLDLRFTGSLILHVIPLCTSLKGQFTPKTIKKHMHDISDRMEPDG